MSGHAPVMLSEVRDAMAPRDGAQYVDGTFGGGGHTRSLLESASCTVLALDRDPDAIRRGETLAAEFKNRLTLVNAPFSRLEEFVRETDGVLFDLGVSSFQIDEAERGFSLREDGPLDMRMAKEGTSAADFVNSADEKTLADIIARYGEERQARRIARAIVAARPIERTMQLSEIVSRALGPAAQRYAIHPATRTFQALRIHVNDELGELARGLEVAARVLKPKGRLAVISFHSLEDRMVKQFLAERSTSAPRGSRHAPDVSAKRPQFRLITQKPRIPGAAEIERNPRARSARLRAAERLAA